MNNVAIQNLNVINDYSSDDEIIYDGLKLSLIHKDEYESITKIHSLEYPIYSHINVSHIFLKYFFIIL